MFNNMKVISDDGLEEFLSSLGVYETFVVGKEKCFNCLVVVSEDNLSAIFPDDNEVDFCCKENKCIEKLSRFTDCAMRK